MNVPHWEEEYKYTMTHNERNKRGKIAFNQLLTYCKSFEQLPLQDQDMIHSFLRQNASEKRQDVMDTWLQIQDDALRLYESLGLELEKQEIYEINHLKRKHDYMPFIRSFIQGLYEEGHLQSMADLS
ncbi:unnamed protein product [Mucor fragilis]